MVLAKDDMDTEVEPPMEIYVVVQDINDKAPVCANEESVFEVQEDEPIGKCDCCRPWPTFKDKALMDSCFQAAW